MIEEQRHTTVGSEQTDPPVQILLCGGRSGLAWGIRGSILHLVTKWVALVTLNKCGWDNMSLVA